MMSHLTVELAPTTEKRIRAFAADLRTSMSDAAPNDFVVASFYTQSLLSTLLKLDLRDMLARALPQESITPSADTERERIVEEAVRQMQEAHVAKRDEAVEAISRKNRLQAEVAQLDRGIAALEYEATVALRAGQRERAKELLRQRAKRAQMLVARRSDLAAAVAAANLVKQDIRQEETRLRKQVAEALAIATSRHASQVIERAHNQLFEVYLGRSASQDAANGTSGTEQEHAMRFDLELPEEAEAIIDSEAERRGLTSQEYVARIVDGVAQLAELVTPQEMAQNIPADTYEETAEEMVVAAISALKTNQIRNRERAVQVITQKNNLAAELDRQKRLIAELERKAMEARSDGNRGLALAFYRQMQTQEHVLERLLPLFAEATRWAEQVRSEIARDEERLRVRTMEALLLKARQKAEAAAFRLGASVIDSDFTPSVDLDADFERWAQRYEPPLPVTDDPKSYSSRDEDIEATLRALDEKIERQEKLKRQDRE